MNYASLSIKELHRRWVTKQLNAITVTESCLDAIHAVNPQLNAWTTITASRALHAAQQLDRQRDNGGDFAALAAIPYAVKNLFDVHDEVTLAGAELFSQSPVAAEDAWAIQKLNQSGAILTGMLNMDAYAYGFTTENSHYGACRNPLETSRIAGGSSGGSAAAVAAGLVHFSLGTDTNGSIRVPASLCGVFGLKPTFGRLSRRGSHPFVASLDHIGPLARRVDDLALVYDHLQGHDTQDRFQSNQPINLVSEQLGKRKKPLRVAVLGGYFTRLADGEARAITAAVAGALGADREVELVDAELARAAAFLLTASEGGSHYLNALRTSPERFEVNSRERLLAGCMLPASWPMQAQRFREHFTRQILALFEQFDLLIAPATPCAAPLIGQASIEIQGKTLPAKASMGMLAQPISYVGLPVCTAPVRTANGLSIGVQLIAAPYQEAIALEAAWQLEQAGITLHHHF
ncbi:AtzE family amidohydrolase [Rosenbergiella collisarenosi]|uniref:AtzE family amidohydrolase n=1 Tax=Rosenbergiella collisarenosi TaxID=1544695 RepID=UPI001BDB4874|nr:AtzE family amidohydrolase [Rosenbergiella collisarenosi]MBT0722654.1 AtzE family amidohydrolase [Rosenbergiella collisarenosi]